MKKLLIYLVVIPLTFGVFAQAPQKMSYQCVVRNNSGALVINQGIGLKITILQGSPAGTIVYQETYSPNPQTNANGLLSVEIGGGVSITGTFSAINWASGPYYLKTETDPAGGTNYTIVGTSQLLSVPFALYSKTASTANYNDLTNLPSLNISNWNTAYSWGNHAGLYRPAAWVPSWSDVTGKPSFATVATTGSYNDLTNKPLLPAPGGVSGNVQFNNAGVLGGDALFTWDNSTKKLGIGTSTPDFTLEVTGSVYRSINVETSNSGGAAIYSVASSASGSNVGVRGLSFSTNGSGVMGDATASTGTTYGIRGAVNSASGFSGYFTGGKFYVQKSAGFGTSDPDATLHVEGTVKIGAAGKLFTDLIEFTGTTGGAGTNYIMVSFPSGYTMSNTRVLSVEINTGSGWVGIGYSNLSATEVPVSYYLGSTSIYIMYPNVSTYQTKSFRTMLMKIQ
jgi:trimeric autotransporter adhesin